MRCHAVAARKRVLISFLSASITQHVRAVDLSMRFDWKP
jgi:hypothetical protein